MRFFQLPDHIASVLLVFISMPLNTLNSSKSSNNLSTESQSHTRTVASFADCVILISFWPTLMPLILGSFLTP